MRILKQRGFNVLYDGSVFKPWYVIDPATNPHVAKWDFLMAVGLARSPASPPSKPLVPAPPACPLSSPSA